MWPVRELFERRLARRGARKCLNLSRGSVSVTFTFDDVPRSACTTGADILEAGGGRGTYFPCGNFESNTSDEQYFFSRHDLHRLHAAGHEIGSHGYAHLNYQQVSLDIVQQDLQKNEEYLAASGLGIPKSFAYPFGCLNRKVKSLCERRYSICRGVEQRLNETTADVGLLKAYQLYASSMTETKLESIFAKASRTGGWLVFLSHGVSDAAGPFDATPRLLSHAVDLAAAFDLPIQPLSQAMSSFDP